LAETNWNKLVAQILGIVLVLVGILGFIPALVPSDALLGIFAVNALHNVIHLLTGVVLVWAGFAMGGKNARMTNMVLGVVYLLVAIVGFAAQSFSMGLLAGPAASSTNWLADNLLHLLLAIVLLGVSFAMKEEASMGMGKSTM
jgi:hypothetical protein